MEYNNDEIINVYIIWRLFVNEEISSCVLSSSLMNWMFVDAVLYKQQSNLPLFHQNINALCSNYFDISQ